MEPPVLGAPEPELLQRLDPRAARDEFPQLSDCTYLNSNSTGLFPRGMEAVLAAYWQTLSHWRDEVWEQWWSELHAYADELAALLGAPSGSVVTDCNLSSLLGRLGTCFDYRGTRRRIVVSGAEFPTVPFIWSGLARYGAELLVVPTEGLLVDEDAICAAIDERTLLVCLSHAVFNTGQLLDVERIARHAHAAGALVVVDAYQSVGTVPIDVRELDADFVLGGAHKWLCGSTESGFMYVRPSLLPTLRPAATGWVASENPLSFQSATQYAASARRFATGTPQILPCLLSRVGLRIIAAVGMERIRNLSLHYTQRVMERADAAGLDVVTPRAAASRGGIVGLRCRGDQAVAAELVRRGYICSYRGVLRIAPHFYNTEEEIEQFMAVLCELVQRG